MRNVSNAHSGVQLALMAVLALHVSPQVRLDFQVSARVQTAISVTAKMRNVYSALSHASIASVRQIVFHVSLQQLPGLRLPVVALPATTVPEQRLNAYFVISDVQHAPTAINV
jgi:hypothetical protein